MAFTVIAVIALVYMHIDARKPIKEKDKKEKTVDDQVDKIQPPSLPVMTQFDYGQMQLDYIDQIVSALIEIKIANTVILGQSYSTLHIDTDIEELATEVKNALQPKFFNENYSMYSNTFLIKYIVVKCKIGLISASKKQS